MYVFMIFHFFLHIIKRKGDDKMTHSSQSKAQQEHDRENKQNKQKANKKITDKYLDGPNEPAT